MKNYTAKWSGWGAVRPFSTRGKHHAWEIRKGSREVIVLELNTEARPRNKGLRRSQEGQWIWRGPVCVCISEPHQFKKGLMDTVDSLGFVPKVKENHWRIAHSDTHKRTCNIPPPWGQGLHGFCSSWIHPSINRQWVVSRGSALEVGYQGRQREQLVTGGL